MSNRKYVIDTSVFLTDHLSIVKFGSHDIIIPLKVLEEIDKHKKRQDVVGSNARNIVRFLDKLRENGSLHDGVSLGDHKGTLYVRGYDSSFIPEELDKKNFLQITLFRFPTMALGLNLLLMKKLEI